MWPRGSKAICGWASVPKLRYAIGQNGLFALSRIQEGGVEGFGSMLMMRPMLVEAKATTARWRNGSTPTAYGNGSEKGVAGGTGRGIGAGTIPLRSILT